MRLAVRLALRWGIADVPAWLESLRPEVLDFWVAVDRVEPIDSEWKHTGTVAAAAANVAAFYCAAKGVELKPWTPEDYVPRVVPNREPRRRRMSGEEVRAVLERRFG